MPAFASGDLQRRVLRVVAVVAVVVAVTVWWVGADEPDASLGIDDATVAPPLQCDDSITIGVVTDLSGGLSILGAPLGRGVPIGLGYLSEDGVVQTGADQVYRIGECDVRLLIRDDQSNPEVAKSAAQQLVDDEGTVLLIGSTSPGTTAALRDVARDRDVVLIATTDTPTGLAGVNFDPNSVLLAPTAYQDAMTACEYWAGTDDQVTFAQIAPDYPLGQRTAAAIRDACTFAGGDFVADDILAPTGASDFVSLLSPAADADVLLVTWTGGGLRQLLTDAAAASLPNVSAPFPSNALLPLWFADATGMTSSIPYHFTVPANEAHDFLWTQSLAAGFRPDISEAHGMNAALMAVAALRVAEGPTDAGALMEALEGLRFLGPKGLIEIRAEDHISLQDMYVVKLVSPTDGEQRFYETVKTFRPEPPCLLESEFAARCGELPSGSLGG